MLPHRAEMVADRHMAILVIPVDEWLLHCLREAITTGAHARKNTTTDRGEIHNSLHQVLIARRRVARSLIMDGTVLRTVISDALPHRLRTIAVGMYEVVQVTAEPAQAPRRVQDRMAGRGVEIN
jgi:hypothetical protein